MSCLKEKRIKSNGGENHTARFNAAGESEETERLKRQQQIAYQTLEAERVEETMIDVNKHELAITFREYVAGNLEGSIITLLTVSHTLIWSMSTFRRLDTSRKAEERDSPRKYFSSQRNENTRDDARFS